MVFPHQSMDKRIQKSILYISKNFRKGVLLDELAEVSHLSKFHFQKIFKKETGQSPLQYINKIRLEHAAHTLVMYSNRKMADVAFECGYSSPAVFTRSFRQFYNTSPSAYQKARTKELKAYSPDYSIPITYLSRKLVQVQLTNLEPFNVSQLYRSIKSEISEPVFAYGIFLDAPFHRPRKECRYYVGQEIPSDQKNKHQNIFELEEGYYTYLEVSGDWESFAKSLIEFKENEIDPSPYMISSLIGFEKTKLVADQHNFDYFKAQRTLYIKIERK